MLGARLMHRIGSQPMHPSQLAREGSWDLFVYALNLLDQVPRLSRQFPDKPPRFSALGRIEAMFVGIPITSGSAAAGPVHATAE